MVQKNKLRIEEQFQKFTKLNVTLLLQTSAARDIPFKACGQRWIYSVYSEGLNTYALFFQIFIVQMVKSSHHFFLQLTSIDLLVLL